MFATRAPVCGLSTSSSAWANEACKGEESAPAAFHVRLPTGCSAGARSSTWGESKPMGRSTAMFGDYERTRGHQPPLLSRPDRVLRELALPVTNKGECELEWRENTHKSNGSCARHTLHALACAACVFAHGARARILLLFYGLDCTDTGATSSVLSRNCVPNHVMAIGSKNWSDFYFAAVFRIALCDALLTAPNNKS